MTLAGAAASPPSQTPGLARRMACFVYEGVLLFGVLMTSGFLFFGLTHQRHLKFEHGEFQAVLFVVLGLYFVWFWSHGGQTVAMKAWHIRVVDAEGRPVRPWRALMRYLLAWLWFLPALALLWMLGAHRPGPIFGTLAIGIVLYAVISRAHPQRQFLHDVLCGTRLVTQRPAT